MIGEQSSKLSSLFFLSTAVISIIFIGYFGASIPQDKSTYFTEIQSSRVDYVYPSEWNQSTVCAKMQHINHKFVIVFATRGNENKSSIYITESDDATIWNEPRIIYESEYRIRNLEIFNHNGSLSVAFVMDVDAYNTNLFVIDEKDNWVPHAIFQEPGGSKAIRCNISGQVNIGGVNYIVFFKKITDTEVGSESNTTLVFVPVSHLYDRDYYFTKELSNDSMPYMAEINSTVIGFEGSKATVYRNWPSGNSTTIYSMDTIHDLNTLNQTGYVATNTGIWKIEYKGTLIQTRIIQHQALSVVPEINGIYAVWITSSGGLRMAKYTPDGLALWIINITADDVVVNEVDTIQDQNGSVVIFTSNRWGEFDIYTLIKGNIIRITKTLGNESDPRIFQSENGGYTIICKYTSDGMDGVDSVYYHSPDGVRWYLVNDDPIVPVKDDTLAFDDGIYITSYGNGIYYKHKDSGWNKIEIKNADGRISITKTDDKGFSSYYTSEGRLVRSDFIISKRCENREENSNMIGLFLSFTMLSLIILYWLFVEISRD